MYGIHNQINLEGAYATLRVLFNGTVEILQCFRINNSTLMFPLTVHT